MVGRGIMAMLFVTAVLPGHEGPEYIECHKLPYPRGWALTSFNPDKKRLAPRRPRVTVHRR